MYTYNLESEVSRLRGDVVFVGAAIVGALLLNAFIVSQIANDLHYLKEMEKEKLKSQIPSLENDIAEASETATEKPKETKEQKPVTETTTESETKTDEKQ